MNYYQLIKEESILKIKTLTNNEEIIEILNELEEKYGLESILPFYEEVINLLKMGEDLNKELMLTYYKLYSNTFYYAGQKLSDAIYALKYSIINRYPWYIRLKIKIIDWIKQLMK